MDSSIGSYMLKTLALTCSCQRSVLWLRWLLQLSNTTFFVCFFYWRTTAKPHWVTQWFCPVWHSNQIYPLIHSFPKNCKHAFLWAHVLPVQPHCLCVSFTVALRLAPCSTAQHFKPNYKCASRCWHSNGEGSSLTCMASISSLTTMSVFTLAVNCPLLGSLVPTCWILSFLFFPFCLPTDWERSDSADSWLRFLSHMQPDTPN